MQPIEIDNKVLVKKKWLKAFCIYMGFQLSMVIFSVMMMIYLGEEFLVDLSMNMAVIQLVFFTTMTYYCAYKCEGTAWLQFILFATPITLALGFIGSLTESSYEGLAIDIVLIFPLTSYFLFHCYKLRQCYLEKNVLLEA